MIYLVNDFGHFGRSTSLHLFLPIGSNATDRTERIASFLGPTIRLPSVFSPQEWGEAKILKIIIVVIVKKLFFVNFLSPNFND